MEHHVHRAIFRLEACLSGLTKSKTNVFTMCISFRPQQSLEEAPNNGKRRHLIATHNYHDHATEAPSTDDLSSTFARGPSSFPLKLYDMLKDVEDQGLSHVVSWQSHGRAFIVHKPDQFREMLPTYFKLSKIPSFQRQVRGVV
jgi:hypothetical protein